MHCAPCNYLHSSPCPLQLGSHETSLKDGWGLATNGTHLLVTDNTPVLSYVDPATFKVVRTVTINDEGTPVPWVNEVGCREERWGGNLGSVKEQAVIEHAFIRCRLVVV